MKRKILAGLMGCALILSGCAQTTAKQPAGTDVASEAAENSRTETGEPTDPSAQPGTSENAANAQIVENIPVPEDMFTTRDLETGYDEENSPWIVLDGDRASCDSSAVTIDGSMVTIGDEGTYILSGILNGGTIIVEAEKTDKVQLVLNGVSVSNTDSTAIFVRQADKVVITTAPDTENTLTNGGSYQAIGDTSNIDAVIFSKADLTLNGSGTLKIDAAAGHGVVSKDDLAVTSGIYDIQAAGHGLSGKDSVRISNGSVKVESGKDGIHAENSDDDALGFVYISGGTFEITSDGDGVSSSAEMWIINGDFSIQAGGGSVEAPAKTENPMGGQRGQKPGGGGMRQPDANGGTLPERRPMERQGAPEPSTAPGTVGVVYNGAGAATVADSENASADTVSTKGIKAGTALYLNDGTFSIDSADDALHSNGDILITGGTFTIATGDDGVHADNAAVISGGVLEIEKSYEGIEGLTIEIAGGEITVTASDDGLNAAGGNDGSGAGMRGDSFAAENGAKILISGGHTVITASGDGVDSNGSVYVSGGETYVNGPAGSGDAFLDYNGEAVITGGIFAAVGSSGMAQNFSGSSTQGSMLVPVTGGTAGDGITLTDADGNRLVSWQCEKDYSCVLISCPGLETDGVYTLETGETSSEITMSSLIYGGGMKGGGKGTGGMRKGQ